MATFIRCVEKIEKGMVRHHAADALGDGRTLCGYAYEGSCIKSEGDHGVTESPRGKVDCETCLRIIRYCKRVPASALAHNG